MTTQVSGDALAALAAKWRATGKHVQSWHATMGTGYIVCADELDALIAAQGSAPALQQEQGFAGRLDTGFAGLPEHLQPSNLPVRAAAVDPREDPTYVPTYEDGLGWGSHARTTTNSGDQGGPSEQPRPAGDRGGPVPGR